MKFKHGVVGGTFDHFHKGHLKLLEESLKLSEKLTVGITLPVMHKNKKYKDSIEEYHIREQYILNFIKKYDTEKRTTIIPIADSFGTTLSDATFDGIIVSPDTKKVAEKINVFRKEKSLSEMKIVTVPFERGDDNEIISSERIRRGLIDRQGNSYLLFLHKNKRYTLPEHLREELKKPSGDIYLSHDAIKHFFNDTVICVGDIVSYYCMSHKLVPHIAIVDLKTQRQEIEPKIKDLFNPTKKLENKPGTINTSFGNIFLTMLSKKSQQVLLIDGEEDLLTLPAILLSPLGSTIMYGQKDIGMICVVVTEEKKQFAKNLLSQFRHN